MLSQAANVVSLQCFGAKLEPGALMSDHSDGVRGGMLSAWPEAPHGQCWPHISVKYFKGTFAKKSHPHFDTIKEHLDAVHFSTSEGMRDFLAVEIGKFTKISSSI